jgi:hypothetical protein
MLDDADALLAKLPRDAREAFVRADAANERMRAGDQTGYAESMKEAGLALAAVGIPTAPPSGEIYPLASTYDDVQRAALMWSALKGLTTYPYACPSTGPTRLRWLGVEPGVLETELVDIEHDGVTTREPLWRALQIANRVERQGEVLDALSMEKVLVALEEIYGVGGGYRINSTLLFPHGNLRVLRDLKGEGRAWAIGWADRMTDEPRWKASALRAFVVLALVRAKVPFEPRWDHLFSNFFGATKEFLFECARALPDDRRDAMLGPQLPSIHWSTEMIDMFPSAALVRALLAGSEASSPRWLWLVEQMRVLGKKHEAVREAVEAIVAATPKPIELYVTSILKPKEPSELTALQKEQLLIGVRGYEEAFDIEERLPSDGTAVPLPGDLQIRAIANAEGEALYDSFTYMADAGIIFKAGTTEEVGGLAQGGVILTAKNDALRNALQVALSNKPLKLAARRKSKTTAKKRAGTTTKKPAKKKK